MKIPRHPLDPSLDAAIKSLRDALVEHRASGYDADDLAIALNYSIRHNDECLFDHLLMSGADPNRRVDIFDSPLYSAVEHQRLHFLQRLLEAGGDPNARNGDGWTALHNAVDIEAITASETRTEPTAEFIAVLLKYGADPSIPDD